MTPEYTDCSYSTSSAITTKKTPFSVTFQQSLGQAENQQSLVQAEKQPTPFTSLCFLILLALIQGYP